MKTQKKEFFIFFYLISLFHLNLVRFFLYYQDTLAATFGFASLDLCVPYTDLLHILLILLIDCAEPISHQQSPSCYFARCLKFTSR